MGFVIAIGLLVRHTWRSGPYHTREDQTRQTHAMSAKHGICNREFNLDAVSIDAGVFSHEVGKLLCLGASKHHILREEQQGQATSYRGSILRMRWGVYV
jgi:hypothetical protein